MTPTELEQQLCEHERRLAAIERAETVEASAVSIDPTPGMVAFVSEVVSRFERQGKFIDRDTLTEIVNRHVGPELATLRAENERLTKAKCGADGYIDLLQSDREKLRQQLTTKDAEIERLKEDTIKTCQLVADMHAAATGKPGDGPRRGVVEDIADLRQQLASLRAENERLKQSSDDAGFVVKVANDRIAALKQQLATHRERDEAVEAVEAMEALAANPTWELYYSYTRGEWRIAERVSGRFIAMAPTPTAAILAAKAASGTTKGGE